ncbi:MAG: NUDIX hydrolase [Candidatus Moranbacteria bacterium GW2011_GWD2_38_7]|nr:MAG: NUDIX hydrolase, 7,8-dihydro-8-oxoguanine triphosphatase [Parcubacteria group bacterium GW2011_GWC1_38_22]KKQ80443.1 MAG: NUDIX hydrolase [Candidatus Moranbacteria bacterium GW2011_GWD2_38_7]
MKRMKIATAAIISRNGKYLIAKRKVGGIVGGKWEFPGGKVDGDESPKGALARELNEELDINANVGEIFDEHVHRYSTGTIKCLAYKIDFFTGKIELKEHDELRWVFPREFDKIDFVGNDKPICKKIRKLYS